MVGPIRSKSRRKVEDYRPGYPRYTALLAAHPAFQNFRRFTRTRMRLLLLKQDEVSTLEESLDSVDASENQEFFLGCSRRDGNSERQVILRKLTVALKEYDEMMEHNHRILCLPEATNRDLDSLRNWIKGAGSISRHETAYLDRFADHLNVTGSADQAITRIEALVEDLTIWAGYKLRECCPCLFRRRNSPVTRDENIFILGPRLRILSRMMTTWVAGIVLMVPIIVLYNISSPKGRLVAIVLTATVFLSVVSVLTRARTLEIIAAGASYAAVLVVFTSANNGINPKNSSA